MFSMKNIEAAHCSGICYPAYDDPLCGSNDCLCKRVNPMFGVCIDPTALSSSVAKMIDEDPNLCESDEECIKKGTGNFCARYPNQYMDYGWCFNSDSEQLKSFFAMPRANSN
ncbi:hypothetical protein PHAVU_011G204800 [Phaseolus vulgaris]|uniref:Albumin I chain a domain-containing protein n=2 Tax=Phaseolus vulgaris TaxID=3885 RepID=V7AJK9_PHAVU|nr:hypothetical protein PHAVU_011G204800g [Phaseolus vulgaris]ESW05729.1 hypothetical protein PHAVU_011G204800g [Phaseolus vulgaris]